MVRNVYMFALRKPRHGEQYAKSRLALRSRTVWRTAKLLRCYLYMDTYGTYGTWYKNDLQGLTHVSYRQESCQDSCHVCYFKSES